MHLGDSNTTYFNKVEKDRAMRDSRLCRLDQHGRILTTREKLIREGIDFYSKLFKERPTVDSTRWFPQLVIDEWIYGLIGYHWRLKFIKLSDLWPPTNHQDRMDSHEVF